jgi:hypothetical protein
MESESHLKLLCFHRLQLEERLAQEARERRIEDRKLDDVKKLTLDDFKLKNSYSDVRKSPVDDRRRDQVHFVLGGDK